MATEIWNRWASPGTSSSAAAFRSLTGMLSGPAVLWGYKSFKSFSTPLVSTLTGGIVSVLLGPKSGRPVVSSLVKTEQNC